MIRFDLEWVKMKCSDSFQFEDVCRAALMTAVEQKCQVNFVYQGTEYRVSFNDLMGHIKDPLKVCVSIKDQRK